jgi:hypothetical protein
MSTQTPGTNTSTLSCLSKEEIENPYLALYRLFDYAKLQTLKEQLWRWLRITVTNGYRKSYYTYRDRDEVIELYEKLLSLLEAAHLLFNGKEEEMRLLAKSIEKSRWLSEEDETENTNERINEVLNSFESLLKKYNKEP